jgi:hypothetical protein
LVPEITYIRTPSPKCPDGKDLVIGARWFYETPVRG